MYGMASRFYLDWKAARIWEEHQKMGASDPCFEERARYHNLGYSNVFTGEKMNSENWTEQQFRDWNAHYQAQSTAQLSALGRNYGTNPPSSATPLVDQYLPTFAFTAEERKQVEELLRKGLRE